LEDLKLNFSS